MEAYYYGGMSKEDRGIYYRLYAGLRDLQTSFEVPRAEGKPLGDIYLRLRLDHPELFYAPTFSWRAAPGAETVLLSPAYLFDRKKLRPHIDAMQARREKLLRPIRDRSGEEQLLYIHDFICSNVRYDKLKKEYSHEILGPLGQGVGVCEGIAKTVKFLCDGLDLPCIVVISENAPDKGIKYRHTWNVVRLENRWYHLDATFDNSLGEPERHRYDYFLLSDKQSFRDHEPAIWPAPPCTDGDRFYYRTRRLSLTKTEDVRRRTAQAVKKGKPLVFHWRGGYLTRDVLAELAALMEEEASRAGCTLRITVNRPQAVLRAAPQRAAAGTLEMENANEGENYPGEIG